MAKTMVKDLVEHYRHTFRVLYEEMGRFDDDQWRKGLSFFQTPVNQAMHIFDCLDFYFREDFSTEYAWGHRFGGGWWELAPEQVPSRAVVEAYARELEARIMRIMSSLEDEDLSKPYLGSPDWPLTLLGWYMYADRHTLHHHGQMAALAVFHGLEGGSWD